MNKDQRAKIEPDFNKASKLWHDGRRDDAIKIFATLDHKFFGAFKVLAEKS